MKNKEASPEPAKILLSSSWDGASSDPRQVPSCLSPRGAETRVRGDPAQPLPCPAVSARLPCHLDCCGSYGTSLNSPGGGFSEDTWICHGYETVANQSPRLLPLSGLKSPLGGGRMENFPSRACRDLMGRQWADTHPGSCLPDVSLCAIRGISSRNPSLCVAGLEWGCWMRRGPRQSLTEARLHQDSALPHPQQSVLPVRVALLPAP